MPLSNKAKENKKQYSIQYAKKNYKRIPLDVRFEQYNRIVKASQKNSESINGYIKQAIEDRLKKDKV